MFQTIILINKMGNFCVIIGDVHQFINYFLLPLDPWGGSFQWMTQN